MPNTSPLEGLTDAHRHALADRLQQGAAALRLSLNATQCEKLLDYLTMLVKWGSVYNLTAIREPEEIAVRHFLDSLALAPHLKGPRILDVGTGAGLPGIPLAIAFPDLDFTLLDSVAKKTRFVLQVAGELGLSNVMVKTIRAENYRPDQPFDTVISRAFASVAEFVGIASELCRPGGLLLAMKGRNDQEELAGLPKGFRVDEVVRLTVPGLNEERHVVRLSR